MAGPATTPTPVKWSRKTWTTEHTAAMSSEPDNREIVRRAFEDWSSGIGYISALFADDLSWEIVGRSVVSATYSSKQEFVDRVLAPFSARFGSEDPFRPVAIRSVVADGEVVVVIWDGRGTTNAGTTYENTYAWIMRLQDGLVVDATAFFDSIAFNELWQSA
jgi:ketosteroid isomerase-like protein